MQTANGKAEEWAFCFWNSHRGLTAGYSRRLVFAMSVHCLSAWIIFLCNVLWLLEPSVGNVPTSKLAMDFLERYNTRATGMSKITTRMSWQYETDLSEINLRQSIESSTKATKFFIEGSDNSSALLTMPDLPKNITRQLMLISRSASPKAEDKLRLLNELQANMTQIYSKGKVYYLDKQTAKRQYLELDPDLINIMAKSRDYNKLLFAWKGWRDAVGPQMKPLYEQFVNIVDLGAREHDWVDNGYFERSHYELGADFKPTLNKAWEEVRPLYDELHAYVRYKLSLHYKNVSVHKPIPAHLLGDMWAQTWDNIFELVNPYPNSSTFDVTSNLRAQNYTVQKMFELAQSFYISIGLDPMPFAFWNMSLFEKPKTRKAVCHASAWDFSDGEVR